MRIAQISTVAETIREDAAGNVESQVWLMARELTRRGHEVTTFGAGGSQVDGEFVATLPGPYGNEASLNDWQLCEWVNLCEAITQSSRFDVLHSHVNLWGLPLEALSNAPIVHTMHVMPEEDSARLWRQYPNARVIALSKQQYSAYPDLTPIAVIPYAVDMPFKLDRAPVRQDAEEELSMARMISHHEQVYRAVCGAAGFA